MVDLSTFLLTFIQVLQEQVLSLTMCEVPDKGHYDAPSLGTSGL